MSDRSYAQKLRDPRWQRKRLEVLSRDNWTCTKCGRNDLELHVHHDYYIYGFEPWEYDMDILKTRCFKCHESEHSMVAELKFCTCCLCEEKMDGAIAAAKNGLEEPFCEGCALRSEAWRKFVE